MNQVPSFISIHSNGFIFHEKISVEEKKSWIWYKHHLPYFVSPFSGHHECDINMEMMNNFKSRRIVWKKLNASRINFFPFSCTIISNVTFFSSFIFVHAMGYKQFKYLLEVKKSDNMNLNILWFSFSLRKFSDS